MSTPIAPGSRFGPYEVLGLLGTGGMGEVYLARDPRIGREVALKILPAGLSADPDRQRRFEQEARTTGLLNHQNVVTVFDVGTEGGVPFLVCELLEGTSLRASLDQGPLSSRRAVEIAVQVARGLAAAHGKGVVHRDLKPENIFVTSDGRVKILDFGIAKLSQPEAAPLDAIATVQATEPGLILGTASYMSPEQVAGRVVDARSDLFSFGVVLYEMLSGRRPFAGETRVETMTAILREEVAPPSSVNPAIAPVLDRVVLHCLEKTPEARFQTARDLAFALESVADTTGVAAPVDGEARGSSWARLRASLGAGMWWLPVGVLVGAAGWIAMKPAPRTATGPTFSRVTRLVATDANEAAPVLSPDGKWMAYSGEAGDRTDVYVRFLSGAQTVNLTAGEPQVFVATHRAIGGLDISPDGTEIVFDGGARGAIASQQSSYVIPAPLGGTARKLVDGGLAVRWSPDGKRIAYMVPGGSAGDSLWVADATGEHSKEIVPLSGGIHTHWPSWSADGRFVYFNYGVNSSNFEPTEIFRVSVAGGAPERVIATSRRAIYPCPSPDGRGLLYSSNPLGVELSLWWKPFDGDPVRVTTGVGDYAEARLSRDGRSMVATVYQGRQSLVTLAAGGESPSTVPLSAGATGDSDPVFSLRSDRIAFSSTRGGDRNIWTARPDGTDARLVTSGAAIDERPAWSPDATKIAFVSSRGGERSVWVSDVDGGAPRRVVKAQVLDTITWSPDGQEVVYSAPIGEVPGLFRVPVSGGAPRRIPTPGGATAPAWSAVTNEIAYLEPHRAVGATPTRAQVAFVTATGQVPRPPMTDGPTLGNGSLAWSPDGRSLAGVRDPGGALAEVWLIPLDRKARRLVELSKDRRPRGITWTSDGARVIIGLVERTGDVVLFEQ